jgi:RNA polymerase sigma-70 factor (ECF subfamily)
MVATTMDSPHATGPVSHPNHPPSPGHDRVAGRSHASPPSGIFAAEDRQLLHDCLDGQPAAWDTFVARFGGLLAFVVDRTAAQRRMSLAPADRDDLLADILLEILHHDAAVLRGFAGRSSLATYLAVVARRVAVRGLSRLAEKTHGRRPLVDGHAASHEDDGQALLADREEVERMLRGLDESEARLVRLHHLEARSYGEISRLTGMPLGSIGPALARARQKMRLQAEEQKRMLPPTDPMLTEVELG